MRHKIHRSWSWLCLHWSVNHPKDLLGIFSTSHCSAFRLKERNGCEKLSKDSWCWTGAKDGSSYLRLTYLPFGFGCHHLWFGSWDLNWFDRTTNPTQLHVSLKHVSWKFFSLLLIILTTASLSSKMYKRGSPWEINLFGFRLFRFGSNFRSRSGFPQAVDIGVCVAFRRA